MFDLRPLNCSLSLHFITVLVWTAEHDEWVHVCVGFQRISLVSSFAASLFLGDYAAIDYSDGNYQSELIHPSIHDDTLLFLLVLKTFTLILFYPTKENNENI